MPRSLARVPRTVVSGLFAMAVAGPIGCDSGDDPGSGRDGDSSSLGSAVVAATTAVPSSVSNLAAADASVEGSNLSVDGVLDAGEEFQVSFAGRLRTMRGGYLWLRTLDGADLALLRGGGNPEIPVGYVEAPDEFMMLDDGLSGEESTFLLPPTVESGRYALCTANSGPELCVEVEVDAN